MSVDTKSSQARKDALTESTVMPVIPFCTAICAMALHNPSKGFVPNSGTRSPFLYLLKEAAEIPDKLQSSLAVQERRSIYSFSL